MIATRSMHDALFDIFALVTLISLILSQRPLSEISLLSLSELSSLDRHSLPSYYSIREEPLQIDTTCPPLPLPTVRFTAHKVALLASRRGSVSIQNNNRES
jgi:hypothetical protein